MKTKYLKSAIEFLNITGDKLLSDEAKHALTFGIAERVVNNPHAFGKEDPWFIIIEDVGKICGAVIRTPPNSPILSYFCGDIGEICSSMVKSIHELAPVLPGVVGGNEIVIPFVSEWCAQYKTKVTREMTHRLYRLTELIEPEYADGFIRKAVQEDEGIVIQWATDFYMEAMGEILTDHQRQLYRDRINSGDIYLWDNKGPVSMAVRTRPTRRGISIGGVFTPPEKRNHGYATSCVAALCRELLSDYDFCLLYADLSNPVSNSIYLKMGFKEYCDSSNYYFSEAK